MIVNKLNITIIFVACFLFSTAQFAKKPIFEKREGAEIGAKPCKYDIISRPCILVNPERLSQVRQEVLQKKSERKTIYEDYIKSNADYWVNRPITIPLTGGWIHDFFCTDGSMLEIPGYKMFNSDVPSKCPVCGKTYLNEKILAARRSFEHYWLCGAVRDLSLVYAVEGKKQYAEKAVEILSKYADFYPTGSIIRQTLEEAVVLIPLAESYDLLFDVMTDAQRSHIREKLLWPAAQALTKSGMGGNWGSWHLSAIGVIGYATRHQRFIDFATQQFKAQITNQLGDDGLWPESIHTYHFYPLSGFLAFAEAAMNNGDDLYHWEAKPGKSLEKMFTAPLRYAYPDMRLAAINDGWYESFLPQDQYVMAYYRYRSPEFAWAVQQINRGGKSGVPGDFFDMHYRNLLYGEPLSSRVIKPSFSSINFPVLGIAVLRQGSTLPSDKEMMMTFDYGPFLGHGHPDKMNITLFAKGKLLIPDYGTTGYASPSNQFLKSTPSHNTIVVDGKSQPATKDRNLIAFSEMPAFKLASARTTEIAPGSSWTRTVMMMDEYVVVWDRIDGNEKHQYDWFFHAEGDSLSLSGISGTAFYTRPSDSELSYNFIKDVKRQNLSGNSVKAQWDWDDYGVGLWFMNNDGQTIYTSKMPTDERKQVPLLILRQKSGQAEFLAVVEPMKGRKEKSLIRQVQFTENQNHDLLIDVFFDEQKDQIRLGKMEVSYMKNGTQPVMINLPVK